jgi:hypothetical protein
MTKLAVAFSNFANTLKNVQTTRLCAQLAQKLDVRLVESQKILVLAVTTLYNPQQQRNSLRHYVMK